jgi:sarcosine oxidase / L-pipecolate oxidase
MPEGVLTGAFPGWKGFLRAKRAGWVEARRAMDAVRQDAERMGVQFISGKEGRVEELLYDDTGKDIIGARTADNVQHLATQTILSAGASSDALLNFKKQLRPTAWTLAHVPLTKEEMDKYEKVPVLYGVDRGFFIPSPNKEKYELKICDEHPGYIHLVNDPTRGGEEHSIPFSKQQIPLESERRIRTLLAETSPHLSSRPFSLARICWDADTPDRLFLIDRHPEYASLVVAVGGSGHGFMCSPAVGVLVSDVLEGKMSRRLGRTLGWREEIAKERDWWGTQGRFGAEGKVMDFKDVEGWTSIG